MLEAMSGSRERIRMLRFTWLAAATMCALGCAGDEQSITVRVLADGQRCVVSNYDISCKDIGRYLRETLQIARDRPVSIQVDGTERSEDRGHRVRELVRAAGYSRVISVGFITEPGEDKEKR